MSPCVKPAIVSCHLTQRIAFPCACFRLVDISSSVLTVCLLAHVEGQLVTLQALKPDQTLARQQVE